MSNTFVKDVMLKGTEYSNRSENPYTITASMVGNDVLQNYLTIVNGNQPTKKVDDTVLGSVFHRGMEEIIKENSDSVSGYDITDIETEENLQYNLSNGWTVSGTSDLKIYKKTDTGFIINIHDFKLTKMYAIKKIREDVAGHNYSKQLNILMLLNRKSELYDEEPEYQLTIDAFAKDAKAINGEESHHEINVLPVHIDVVEAELIQLTNLLQQHIESGEIPEACTDVWPRKMRDGTTVNTRCAFYCAHGKNSTCPYYNPNTRQTVARISNW